MNERAHRAPTRTAILRSSVLVTALVAGLVLGLAVIIQIRAGYDGHEAGFLAVLLWQLAVWGPWLLFAPLAISLAVSSDGRERRTQIVSHLVVVIALVAAHYLWFRWASSVTSPYVGLEDTRYGVFAYFFVFWSVLDIALYALAVLIAIDALERDARGVGEGAEPERQPTRFLTVRNAGRNQVVPVEGIRWIEAEDYYAGLHTADGKFLLRESMNALAEQLDPERFVRVHRSTIVNLSFVRSYGSDPRAGWRITLEDGTQRSISRAGRQRLNALLGPERRAD